MSSNLSHIVHSSEILRYAQDDSGKRSFFNYELRVMSFESLFDVCQSFGTEDPSLRSG